MKKIIVFTIICFIIFSSLSAFGANIVNKKEKDCKCGDSDYNDYTDNNDPRFGFILPEE
jgi:hypothetical protein